MSRLRRLVVSDRWFFISCRLLPRRRILSPPEFAILAQVIQERRAEHKFLLTAWVFLPDHWHAIFYPPHLLTISRVMEAIKDGATKRINRTRHEVGMLWQLRFFDRALRTVKEYNEKVEYIHLNPAKAGLATRPEEWPWSSVHDYTGSVQRTVATPSGLSVDRVLLPADRNTRIRTCNECRWMSKGEAAEERKLRVPPRYLLFTESVSFACEMRCFRNCLPIALGVCFNRLGCSEPAEEGFWSLEILFSIGVHLQQNKEEQSMKKLVYLVCALFLTSAVSWGAPCSSGSFTSYVSLGTTGCTVSVTSTSADTYSSFSSNFSPAEAAALILTPVTTGANAGGLTTNVFPLNPGGSNTFDVTITPPSGMSITDFSASVTGGTGYTLSLDLSNGINLTATEGTPASATFSGVSSLGIMGLATVSSSATGSVSLAFTPSFSPSTPPSTVPEPSSFVLLGTASLLGLAWLMLKHPQRLA